MDDPLCKNFRRSTGGTKPSHAWSHFNVEGVRDERTHRRDASCKYCDARFPSARLAELKKHILKLCPSISEEHRHAIAKDISMETTSLTQKSNSSGTSRNQEILPYDVNITSSSPMMMNPYASNNTMSSMSMHPNVLESTSNLYSTSFTGDPNLAHEPVSGSNIKRKLPFTDPVDNMSHQNNMSQHHHLMQGQIPYPSRSMAVNPQLPVYNSVHPDAVNFVIYQWFMAMSIPFEAIDHPYAVQLFNLLRSPRPSLHSLTQLYNDSTMQSDIPHNGISYPTISMPLNISNYEQAFHGSSGNSNQHSPRGRDMNHSQHADTSDSDDDDIKGLV